MNRARGKLGNKSISIFLVFSLLFSLFAGLFPISTAKAAISHPDYGLTGYKWNPSTKSFDHGDQVRVTNGPGPDGDYWFGLQDIYINGSYAGQAMGLVYGQLNKDNGYPYVDIAYAQQWVSAMNGDPTYVSQHWETATMYIPGVGTKTIVLLSSINILSGGRGDGYDSPAQKIWFKATQNPETNIAFENGKVTYKVGETGRFRVWGKTYTSFYKTLNFSWSGNGQSGNFQVAADPNHPKDEPFQHTSEYMNITFTKAGTYTFTVRTRDSAWRIATKSINVAVGEDAPPPPPDDPPDDPPPPPPPPANEPPKARFDMPAIGYKGENIRVRDRSTDADGIIVRWDWDVIPSSGVSGSLGNNGGELTFSKYGTYTVYLEVEDDDGDTDETSKTIEIKNLPPEADFSMPDEAIQGDDVTIVNESFDPDGEIVQNTWTIQPDQGIMNGPLTDNGGTIYFDIPGTYTVTLNVKDDAGMTDSVSKTIEVTPAIPVAKINQSGTEKQNRKLVFHSKDSETSPRYPILHDLDEWELLPVTPGLTQSDIKIKDTGDNSQRVVLFKKPGQYKVRLRVTNQANNLSEWVEKILNILPDEAPVANFNVSTAVTRDPDDANRAKIQLIDASYSPDGDLLAQRIWRYKFDSDNDGSFTDESWVVLDNGNNIAPILKTTHVGKYLFELEVIESFGQETIAEFITADDIRQDDTFDKPYNQKVVDVVNVKPVGSFETAVLPKVDLLLKVGQFYNHDTKFQNLLNKLESALITKLREHNINIEIVNEEFGNEDAGVTVLDQGSKKIIQTRIAKAIVNNTGRYGVMTVEGFPETPNDDNKHILYRGEISNTSSTYIKIGSSVYNFFNDGSGTTVIQGKKLVTKKMFAGVEVAQVISIVEGSHIKISYEIVNNSGSAKDVGVMIYWDTDVAGNDGSPFRVVDGGWIVYSGETKAKATLYGHSQVVRPDYMYLGHWSGSDPGWDYGSKTWYPIDYTYSTSDTAAAMWWMPTTVNNGATKVVSTMLGFTTPGISKLQSVTDTSKTSEWRKDAGVKRFVVSLTDVAYSDYDSSTKAAFFQEVNGRQAEFVMLGSSASRTQGLELIAGTTAGGTFIYTDEQMQQALDALADYIISRLSHNFDSQPKIILVNEAVAYNTKYSDRENDPKMAEQWLYQHNPFYFDNSMGIASFHNIARSTPVDVFTKTGEYKVKYNVRDDPVNGDNRFANYQLWSDDAWGTVLVHRKPVADFEPYADLTGKVYILNYSYDPDDESKANRGIVAEYWQWKEEGAANWQPGKPALLPNLTKSYVIQLNVQDRFGAWSGPLQKTLHAMEVNVPPVALFTVTPNPGSEDHTFSFADQSYDPDGHPIVQRVWSISDDGGNTWKTYSTPPTQYAAGDYLIKLKVRDQPPAPLPSLWSREYEVQLKVYAANQKPVAQFNPTPSPAVADEPIHWNEASYDPDGHVIDRWNWTIKHLESDSSWTFTTREPGFTVFAAAGLPAGTYDITLQVRDNPQVPYLLPKWSDPLTKRLVVEDPLRVIGGVDKTIARSGQAITLTANTEGKAEWVEVKVDWNQDSDFNDENETIALNNKFPVTNKLNEWIKDIIIPFPTRDGDYTITFTAYKTSPWDGSVQTAEDSKTITVRGDIHDDYKVEIYD